jgi:hypothetical protein
LIRLSMSRRDVTCIAELLEVAAPRTCAAISAALPIDWPLWHTKTAGNEVYGLGPGLPDPPRTENGSLIPIPGDLLFFDLPRHVFPPTDPRWIDVGDATSLSCIGSFYERNSIHWMELGFVAGSRFARIVDGFEDWQTACQDVFERGCAGERLVITAVD